MVCQTCFLEQAGIGQKRWVGGGKKQGKYPISVPLICSHVKHRHTRKFIGQNMGVAPSRLMTPWRAKHWCIETRVRVKPSGWTLLTNTNIYYKQFRHFAWGWKEFHWDVSRSVCPCLGRWGSAGVWYWSACPCLGHWGALVSGIGQRVPAWATGGRWCLVLVSVSLPGPLGGAGVWY